MRGVKISLQKKLAQFRKVHKDVKKKKENLSEMLTKVHSVYPSGHSAS